MFLELILEQKTTPSRLLSSKLHCWGHAIVLLQIPKHSGPIFWLAQILYFISCHLKKIYAGTKTILFSLGPAQYVNKCFGTCRRTESRKKHKVLLYVLTSIMWAILCILIVIQAFTFSGLAVTISITILIIFACKY